MKKRLTNNLGMKLGSLVLAVLVWLIIQNVADPVITRDFTAKVEILNEDVLSQEDTDYTYTIVSGDVASFTISGKTSIVNKLSASDFYVYADLSKLSIVNAVPVEITPRSNVNSSVEILSHSNTLQIELDVLTTIQKDITVSTTGDTADGYAVGNTVCDPSLVTISGPAQVLESIDKLVAYVSVSGRRITFTESVELVMLDEDGEEITADNVTIDVDDAVEVTIQIWETATIDVELDFSDVSVADGYAITETAYSPQQITVAAAEEDYDDSAVIQSGTFTCEVQLDEELSETIQGVFLIADYLDENLKIVDADVRENGITYQITVEQEVSASWPVSVDNIVYEGASDTLTYLLASGEDSVSLMVTGLSETLNTAKNSSSDTVQIYLDVSDIGEPGTYTLEIEASLPDGVSLADGQEITIVVETAEDET